VIYRSEVIKRRSTHFTYFELCGRYRLFTWWGLPYGPNDVI